MQNRQTAKRPSIYYFYPALGGPMADWGMHLDRCGEMGFSHVLLAPPFATGRDRNVFLIADYDKWDSGLDAVDSAASALRALVAQCKQRGLSLWLDLVLDRFAADAPLVEEKPAWFARNGDDRLPDPRNIATSGRSAALAFDAGHDAEILAWWQAHLVSWLDAGVEGFRIADPEAVPRNFLRSLIEGAKAHQSVCRFVAWTPGLSPTEVAALEELGIDFSVASTCWWDFREDWYDDEKERLDRVAPSLALAEAPFGARLAERFPNSDALYRGYRRLIEFSATAEHGWLMPMGFEVAAAAPMDPMRADAAGFAAQLRSSNLSLVSEIAQANARGQALADNGAWRWRRLSAPGAGVLAELAEELQRMRLVNADAGRAQNADLGALLGRARHAWMPAGTAATDSGLVRLEPGEVLLLELKPAAAIEIAPPSARRAAKAAAKLPRVVIAHLEPAVEGGRYPAKRVVGQRVEVEADIFTEGHGELAADLRWRAVDEAEWSRTPMKFLGNDRWRASFRPQRVGDHLFTVSAWRDDFAGLQHGTLKKRDAGQKIDLEISELTDHVERRAPAVGERDPRLKEFLARFRRAKAAERVELLLSKEARAVWRDVVPSDQVVTHEPALAVTVDRGAALFSSWYELFPRSQSGSADRHGTFDDVIKRLPAIQAMGFDTLYFPPIHPIGKVNRKGRNNNTRAEPGDPGSPYAIGSSEGGHEAIHPELGTIEDFRRLRDAAAAHGLELALDFAIQCAPDHPWLKQHPEWFAWRPDGSVAYAENPPKKYEDIVNVDFYATGAVPGLWVALRDVVLYWCMEGVRTFRVDNPHTKPLPFWRWMIADIRARFPDTLFLSEAFTRPQVMYELAKIGFSQSYTYFTWRNTKAELETYLTELTAGPPKEFFRPHFFVNTPDINPVFLQRSGRAGFLIRASLAATLSGLWGVYSGFELCEATPLPGREEYLDSEKYEIRAWDWNRPGNIVAEISMLNRLRRRHPALQSHLGLKFHTAHNEQVTFFSKATPERDNVLLIAINLDPFHIQEAPIELPLWHWGLPDDASIEVEDLIGGTRFHWHGKHQSVRLDPYQLPFAIWRVNLPEVAA